ncbi:hypothetical protein RRG08_030620 [Elysia crispata]|uniref:Uncharacterized protein n=1 Tax=Elysia crispata TaxID=231223 RepID=A0AAE0YWY4_9GAST|nr:hypothetical protein RRG08_030620 [Elysia crispata]
MRNVLAVQSRVLWLEDITRDMIQWRLSCPRLTMRDIDGDCVQLLPGNAADLGCRSVLNRRQKKTFRVLIGVVLVGVFSIFYVTRTRATVCRPVPLPLESVVSSLTMDAHAPVVLEKQDKPQTVLKELGGSGPCWPVLNRASFGRWRPRAHTPEEKAAVDKFLVTVRGYQKLPVSVQRKDNKCGNTNMAKHGRRSGLFWYKALCNPLGPKSCCYSNHTCVNLTEKECRCEGCQDLRQQIHAELATWVPHDKNCKLKLYRDEDDLCPLLKNLTIHVIGDSLMRQVFISLVGILRSRHPQGVITDAKIAKDRVEHCDTYMRYFSKCADVIPTEAVECGGTVKIFRDSLWRASQISKILRVFQKNVGQPNTYLVFGLGIHDMYHPDNTIQQILKPVLSVLEKKPPWPQMIWVAPQSPGLLKTPLVKQQQPESVAKFNSVVPPLLKIEESPCPVQ